MSASIFKISDLTDFIQHPLLNTNRRAMSADLIPPITNMIIRVLSIDEILRTTGQDVAISDVEILDDTTFTYKGRRVILHIRDITKYGDELKLPKYHFVNCSTLQGMWKRNRGERYVVSTRHEGVFRLKTSVDGVTWNDLDASLQPCKNCFAELNWESYRNSGRRDRESIFSRFTLSSFFAKYPNSSLTLLPTHTDDTAPVNDYPADFDVISRNLRESVGWRCEECTYDLRDTGFRRFLHVHHIDGMKSNNSPSNLRALCIECHCSQDMHSHLSNGPDLVRFRQLKRERHLGR